MSVKVVDASVVGAIVFLEPEVARAEALVSGAELVAPSLLLLEIANIAWKKSKREPGKAEKWAAGLELALELEVNYFDVDHDEVLETAVERNVTVYDACYLWLARTLKAPLVTFDKKLQAAM